MISRVTSVAEDKIEIIDVQSIWEHAVMRESLREKERKRKRQRKRERKRERERKRDRVRE